MIYPLGLVNTKQREFFFVSSFVLLLAYASTMFLCLCLCRSIFSGFTAFLCFAFCLSSVMLMLSCERGYKPRAEQKTKQKKLSLFCIYKSQRIIMLCFRIDLVLKNFYITHKSSKAHIVLSLYATYINIILLFIRGYPL